MVCQFFTGAALSWSQLHLMAKRDQCAPAAVLLNGDTQRARRSRKPVYTAIRVTQR